MNIDKQKMDSAWEQRNENPRAMTELCGYFKEMAEYFARKFGINAYYRDDYISESLDQAQRALRKFKVGKSSTYSYFYKVMANSYYYSLRRDGRKRAKMPNMCSFDNLQNMADDIAYKNGIHLTIDPNSLEEEPSNQVIFKGIQYQKDELIEIVKEGKILAKKANKISDPEEKEQFINNIEMPFLKECVIGIIKRKEIRNSKAEAKLNTDIKNEKEKIMSNVLLKKSILMDKGEVI